MKTALELSRDILTNHEKYKLTISDNFIPFLIQKYISGVSPMHCNLVNSILNNKLKVWTDDQEIFDFLKCFIPKKDIGGIEYFGKKKSNKEYKIDIENISNNLEISQKELMQLIDLFPDLEKEYIEDDGKLLKSIK